MTQSKGYFAFRKKKVKKEKKEEEEEIKQKVLEKKSQMVKEMFLNQIFISIQLLTLTEQKLRFKNINQNKLTLNQVFFK